MINQKGDEYQVIILSTVILATSKKNEAKQELDA
jgi:hypothetical protein